jgi:hypothetical protein
MLRNLGQLCSNMTTEMPFGRIDSSRLAKDCQDVTFHHFSHYFTED